MSKVDIVIHYIQHELLKESEDVPLDIDDNLIERNPIDSLDVIRLVDFLERQFEVEIRPREVTIKNFRSIRSMLALIDRKLAEV